MITVVFAGCAYEGFLSRYVADDFCTSTELRDAGFLGAQVYWYTHWTGRFAFVLLIRCPRLGWRVDRALDATRPACRLADVDRRGSGARVESSDRRASGGVLPSLSLGLIALTVALAAVDGTGSRWRVVY